MIGRLLAFVALTAVLLAIPGPAVMLIVKSTVLRGRRSAFGVATGVFCGDLVWATAAVAGLTALVVASRPAFDALRLAGAAYLIYLGVKLLLARRTLPEDDRPTEAVSVRRPAGRSFSEGLLCELSNPKTLLVFTSVIPQFLPSRASNAEIAVFGVLFAVLGFLSLAIYITVLGATRQAVGRRSRAPKILLRGSGGLLVLFGIGLITDHSV